MKSSINFDFSFKEIRINKAVRIPYENGISNFANKFY